MLPPQHRMRRSEQFGVTVRSGRRVGGPVLVVHHSTSAVDPAPAQIGLVVGKGVGSSVVRHRVSRRLRAQLSARLDRLQPGSSVVVRALPASADATSAELGAALDRAFARISPSVSR